MKTVLILGAGQGTRLGLSIPKGFLEINKRKLIDISIDKLVRNGYSTVYIVTGYRKEFYENFSKSRPNINIQCIHNSRFDTHGSGESLLTGLRRILDSCLILESDILYDERMLSLVKEDSTIISTLTGNGDEVYAELFNSRIIGLSKNKKTTNEFVGMTHLSKKTVDEILSKTYEKEFEYEQIIVNFNLKGIETEYKWCEIDDINQLNIASKLYDTIESGSC